MTVKIMAFDGGGVRGALSLRILERLTCQAALCSETDVLAGTSTGAIIAIGLALGLTPSQLLEQYRDLSTKLFPKPKKGIIRPAHSAELFLRLLQSADGFRENVKLADLKKKVILTTFSLDGSTGKIGERGGHWGPLVLSNLPGSPTAGWNIHDAILASAAAPTYFESFIAKTLITDKDAEEKLATAPNFIDGGVYANNPSMEAIAHVLGNAEGAKTLADIRLLSVTSGRNPTVMPGPKKWGLVQWGWPLVRLMLDSTVQAPHEQASSILGDKRYHRIEKQLSKEVKLDDSRQIDWLIARANEVALEPAEDFLAKHYLEGVHTPRSGVYGRRCNITLHLDEREELRSIFDYCGFRSHGGAGLQFSLNVGNLDFADAPHMSRDPLVWSQNGMTFTKKIASKAGFTADLIPPPTPADFRVETFCRYSMPLKQTDLRRRFPEQTGNRDFHQLNFSATIDEAFITYIVPPGCPLKGFKADIRRPNQSGTTPRPHEWSPTELRVHLQRIEPGTQLVLSWDVPE